MSEQYAIRLLELAIGTPIEIVSNEYGENLSSYGDALSHQKIVFRIKEEQPDILAIAVLFSLSLMSFTYASPRGYSENDFIPDEQWSFAYFVEGLEFEDGKLSFSGDYVSGRMMKTDIVYEASGTVTLTTTKVSSQNNMIICYDGVALSCNSIPHETCPGPCSPS
ncbi:MAG: hypothetical protein ABSD38_27325 [Syntrophorhabdales bacterium]|jgi:hypothetical protein